MELKSNIFSKPYAFHLHTTYTDSEIPIRYYFNWAKNNEIQKLIFLEHIRQAVTYDVPEFIDNIKQNSDKFKIKSNIGFEAKLMKNGSLDISNKNKRCADLIGIAIHQFNGGVIDLMSAFVKAIKENDDILLVWVHPGLWFQRNKLLTKECLLYIDMIEYALEKNVLIENNLRYHLPPHILHRLVPQKYSVTGIDSHHFNDLLYIR